MKKTRDQIIIIHLCVFKMDVPTLVLVRVILHTQITDHGSQELCWDKGSALLTFPERHLHPLDWVPAHVLFLCMLEALAHLLGTHGPAQVTTHLVT